MYSEHIVSCFSHRTLQTQPDLFALIRLVGFSPLRSQPHVMHKPWPEYDRFFGDNQVVNSIYISHKQRQGDTKETGFIVYICTFVISIRNK